MRTAARFLVAAVVAATLLLVFSCGPGTKSEKSSDLTYFSHLIEPTDHPQSEKEIRKSIKAAGKDGWELVWNDEFNDTEIDPESWSRCVQGRADWHKHISPVDSLCVEDGGVVRLRAIVNPDTESDPRPYITGGIKTLGKRFMQQGKFEVRAKLGCAQGFWPAIWLMPDCGEPYPRSGEIDIMEHLNYEQQVYQTFHSSWSISNRLAFNVQAPANPEVYNTYAVMIEQDTCRMFLNGKETYAFGRMDPDPGGQFPFPDTHFYVILSAQLGGTWVGPVDTADLPVEMDVDYVRFYQRKEN